MSLLTKLYNPQESFAYWYSRLFPKRLQPSEETLHLLRQMYPNVNWGHVQFHDNLPWYIDSQFTCAIVLPAFFSFRKINIYFADFDEQSIPGRGTIIHEAFHVQQAYECGYGIGFGFFRIFLISYLAIFMERVLRLLGQGYSFSSIHQQAYRFHEMEEPAYYQEELCTNYLNAVGVNAFADEIPSNLIVQNSGHFIESNPLLLLFVAILTILLSSVRIVGDLILSVYCLFLWFSARLSTNKSNLSVSK
ncbi:MAG: hypothetical protein AAF598_03690 [Bacteroidota bacterium]